MIHHRSLARAAVVQRPQLPRLCRPRLVAQPLLAPHQSYATAAATSSSSSHSSYASSVLSPAVLFIVHTQHVDPSSITGSGRAGRLLKSDVLAAIKAGTAKKLSPAQMQQQQQQQQPEGASASVSTPKQQEGPRVTDSGRRNRSALFSSPTQSPHSPAPTAKLQAIDAPPSKPVSAPSGPKPPAAAAPLAAHRGRGRSHDDLPLNNIRKVTAARLLQAKQSLPHSYATATIDITAVLALRSSLKTPPALLPSSPPPHVPSLNDFMVRACALALRRHPQVNSTMDAGSGAYSPSATVDISVAVAIDSGLLTPIVTKADRRRLSDISATVRELAARAKAGKLKLDEFQGGSFTISNLGMFGVHAFSAIINPPQAAILAVGGTHDVARLQQGGLVAAAGAPVAQTPPAVYVPQPAAASPSYSSPAPATAAAAAVPALPVGTAAAASAVSSSPLLSVTLVFDERAIDGEEASRFLRTVSALLEQPEQLLM